MTTAGNVEVNITADASALRAQLAQANRNLEGFATGAKSVAGSLRTVFAGVFAGLSVQAFTSTIVEFEKLKASLETVTGSAKLADQSFDALKKFATETPYGLNQVVEAFIKLKALGLDPSEAALQSYGNTASAMGKSLNQFIEAVADASTGEFERLKEFGIKARKQGDEVRFTFQGVTTTVKNSAEEIQQYLSDIGNNQFAGAMDKQMETLGGSFSNLQDAAAQFAAEMGEAGLSAAIKSATDALTDFIVKATAAIPAVQNDLVRSISGAKTAYYELAAGISEAIAASQEAAAKVTFGDQSQKHLDEARRYTEQARDLWTKAAGETAIQILAIDDMVDSANATTGDIKLPAFAAAGGDGGIEEQSKEVIAALKKEQDLIDAYNAKRFQDDEKEIEDNNRTLKSFKDRAQAIRESLSPLEEYKAKVKELQQLGEFKFLTPEEVRAGIDSAKNDMDDLIDKTKDGEGAAKDLGLAFSSAFEDAIVSGENLRDVMQGLLQDIIRIFVRKQLTEPLADAAGAAFSSFGIPGFAAGTSFAPGGLALVGERGPELVNLPRGSQVYPTGTGPAGGDTIVNVDARGSTDPAATEQAVRRAVQQSIAQIRNMKQRGQLPEFA